MPSLEGVRTCEAEGLHCTVLSLFGESQRGAGGSADPDRDTKVQGVLSGRDVLIPSDFGFVPKKGMESKSDYSVKILTVE